MDKSLQEKYLEVVKLIEDESNKDPKEEPFRSKYKARSILEEMETILRSRLEESDLESSERQKLVAQIVVILLHMGIISIDCEEPSAGESSLIKGFEMITDHTDPRIIISSLNIRNQLGIIWSQRSECEKAQSWLEGAEKLYEDFCRKDPQQTPLTYQQVFENEDSCTDNSQASKELEKVHTLTKFYLAQVYGSLKVLLKSAIYCHETLRRQLVYNEYDPIDWALNSATLSQFFMERELFTQARHHLAAASYILDEYERSLKDMEGTEDEIEAKKEELRHRGADVARCWAKYGIFLLEHSKNCMGDTNGEKDQNEENEALKTLWFTTLNLKEYEDIADSAVVTFADARLVFLTTQAHLNRAKEYYTLEFHASDHVQVVQDHSQLYKHIMAFDNDERIQCKIIKRRISLLEAVLKELNPQYYLHACRQLWFEIGECYHDLVHYSYQRRKNSEYTPTLSDMKRFNLYAEKSIENFDHFVDSIKDKSTKELPAELDEDIVKPTLIAHFYLGRLYYKIIMPDKMKQIENTRKSYESFKYLVDYCDKSEFAKEMLSEELNISKEMMSLLQMKVLQL